jgi:PqqD family protein of HPr-rel-A system
MNSTKLPAAVEPLEVRRAGNDVFVHDVSAGKIHVLNATAAKVLEACDGSMILESLVQSLCAQTGAPRERVEADVRSVLERFASLGLVRS